MLERIKAIKILEENKLTVPGGSAGQMILGKIFCHSPRYCVLSVQYKNLPGNKEEGFIYNKITNLLLIDTSLSKLYVIDTVYEGGKRILLLFPRKRFGYVKMQQPWDDTVQVHYVINPKTGMRQKFRELVLNDGQGYIIKDIKVEQ
ncbi:MAG: hypothetical protein ACP5N3_03540 [Candidatus Nanoarchaeia archaeon]